jgi:hypothetical protein
VHDERHAIVGKHRLLTDVRDHKPDPAIGIRYADSDPVANANADAHTNPDGYAKADRIPHGYAKADRIPDSHAKAHGDAQPHTQADSHGRGNRIRFGIGLSVRERVSIDQRDHDPNPDP